jgi:hypothetical protein
MVAGTDLRPAAQRTPRLRLASPKLTGLGCMRDSHRMRSPISRERTSLLFDGELRVGLNGWRRHAYHACSLYGCLWIAATTTGLEPHAARVPSAAVAGVAAVLWVLIVLGQEPIAAPLARDVGDGVDMASTRSMRGVVVCIVLIVAGLALALFVTNAGWLLVAGFAWGFAEYLWETSPIGRRRRQLGDDESLLQSLRAEHQARRGQRPPTSTEP